MKLQVLTFIAECDRVRKLLRSCKTRSRILQREDFHIECPAFSLSSAPWAGIILKKVTIKDHKRKRAESGGDSISGEAIRCEMCLPDALYSIGYLRKI